MPQLPERAAAYTRTGILKRFLDALSESLPSRIDSAYAESRLGLKGGDVRAFLQSIRVLGLVDPYGHLTERARRTRSVAQRPGAIREGLQEAYPDLVAQWARRGGLTREELEGEFKVHYGLSSSSAGPAAKLFSDLMRDYGHAEPARVPGYSAGTTEAQIAEPSWASASSPGGSSGMPLGPSPGGLAGPTLAPPTPGGTSHPAGPSTPAGTGADVRLAALDAIKSSLRIDINAEWDEDRIQLVFDRMERLMGKILSEG